jgi:lysophospholipase L1-like esterase
MNTLKLESGQTILFTGDSITDADRREPACSPLGRGYVFFAANLLTARHPQLDLTFRNTGIGGDTTRTLLFRWKKDCLAIRPDILSILIGINDVWCQHTDTEWKTRSVYIDEFRQNYTDMLTQVRNELDCQLIIVEPFMFRDTPDNPMYATLKDYITVIRELAEQFGAIYIPLQEELDKLLPEIPPSAWSDDMVHPYDWAHAWIAEQWLSQTDLP